MASDSSSEASVDSPRYYCHACQDETETETEDVVCSRCHQGFVEQLGTSEPSSDAGPLLNSAQRAAGRPVPYNRSMRRMRRMRIAFRQVVPPQTQRHFRDFVNRLIATAPVEESAEEGTSTPREQSMNLLLMPPIRRVGSSYIVHVNRLDNAIIMLLNQLDEAGSGVPPASTEQINALPTVSIIQSQVDAKLQCNICMEDFQLDEPARTLPCNHFYHGVCIATWLQLHGTCPLCRLSVSEPVPPSVH